MKRQSLPNNGTKLNTTPWGLEELLPYLLGTMGDKSRSIAPLSDIVNRNSVIRKFFLDVISVLTVTPMQGHARTSAAEGDASAEAASPTVIEAADLLQSSPCVVLAEAAARPGSGRALSVAPLLGAFASVDPGHQRWLHVHVRPPARGLLKTVRVRFDHCFCVWEFITIWNAHNSSAAMKLYGMLVYDIHSHCWSARRDLFGLHF